jgi:hypothetical protein
MSDSKQVTRGESYLVQAWWRDHEGKDYATAPKIYDSLLAAKSEALEQVSILKGRSWEVWGVDLRKRPWQNSGQGNVWLGSGEEIQSFGPRLFR